MQQHICFDLETLGNNPTSPIISIGAVKFNTEGVYDRFSINVKYDRMTDFEVDYSTIMWWMEQSDAARSFLNVSPVYLNEALIKFKEWIGVSQEYLYWSMATFDPPILQWAFKVENIEPLPFWLFRDYRTLIDLKNVERVHDKLFVKHIASDDAEQEALHIIQGLKN